MVRLKNKRKGRRTRSVLPLIDNEQKKSKRRSRVEDGYAYPTDKFSAKYDTRWHDRIRIYRLVSSLSLYLLTFLSLYACTRIMDSTLDAIGKKDFQLEHAKKKEKKTDSAKKAATNVSLSNVSFDEFLSRNGLEDRPLSKTTKLSNRTSDGHDENEKDMINTKNLTFVSHSKAISDKTTSTPTGGQAMVQDRLKEGNESSISPFSVIGTQVTQNQQPKPDILQASWLDSQTQPKDYKSTIQNNSFKMGKENSNSPFETQQYQKQEPQNDLLQQSSELYPVSNPQLLRFSPLYPMANPQLPRLDFKAAPSSLSPLPQLKPLPLYLPLGSFSNLEDLQNVAPPQRKGTTAVPQVPILPSITGDQFVLQNKYINDLLTPSAGIKLSNVNSLSQSSYNAQSNTLNLPIGMYQPQFPVTQGQAPPR